MFESTSRNKPANIVTARPRESIPSNSAINIPRKVISQPSVNYNNYEQDSYQDQQSQGGSYGNERAQTSKNSKRPTPAPVKKTGVRAFFRRLFRKIFG
jgi:hypothetical protein